MKITCLSEFAKFQIQKLYHNINEINFSNIFKIYIVNDTKIYGKPYAYTNINKYIYKQ